MTGHIWKNIPDDAKLRENRLRRSQELDQSPRIQPNHWPVRCHYCGGHIGSRLFWDGPKRQKGFCTVLCRDTFTLKGIAVRGP